MNYDHFLQLLTLGYYITNVDLCHTLVLPASSKLSSKLTMFHQPVVIRLVAHTAVGRLACRFASGFRSAASC